MKRIVLLWLGIIAFAATDSLIAQTGNFETVNLRNSGALTNAAVLDVGPFNLDLSLDVADDYRIQLGQSTTPQFEIEFDGFTAFNAFEVSRLSTAQYIALVRPNGTNNNLGHLEEGTYGNINAAKWYGIGSAPATLPGPGVYGNRTQWDANFAVFNLQEVSNTEKDLIIGWGGSASNNQLLFNYANAPTAAPTTYMQIESDGRVGVGRVRLATDLFYVDGRIGLGSAEWIDDVGANTVGFQLNIAPSNDGSGTCGTSTLRWNSVFATNGTIQTSDRRAKENIENLSYGLDEIMQLRPVSYTWKQNKEDGTQLGLIAQEAQEVLPEMIYDPSERRVMDEEGNMVPAGTKDDLLGVSYTSLIPVLINGMQEQQSQIEAQQEKIADLEALIANGGLKSSQGSSDLRLPELFQNNPNPFRESTDIRFFIPQSTRDAMLYVYDMQGQPVLELSITERGETSQRIDGGMLDSGMYLYALIVDGQEVDVKRMIMTK